MEENRRQIRDFDIGTLVTKDSGRAGGVPAKLEAARAEHAESSSCGGPPTIRRLFPRSRRCILAVRTVVADFRPTGE